jgi:hypothetical protein
MASRGELEFVILPLVNASFDRETIAIKEIRAISSQGLDGYPPEDRALAWLSMLGIYPDEPQKWVSTYTNHKRMYFQFAQEHGVDQWHLRNIAHQIQLREFGLDDNALIGIVHGDIVRTGRTMFFLPPLPIPTDDPAQRSEQMYEWGGHARRLERILYIFGRLNRGLGYMQGFNELIVPFYYVLLLAQSILNSDMDLVEALAFHCLMTLLNESTLNEFYTTTDHSSMIMHQLEDFENVLRRHLPNVAALIKELDIHPLLYCFRWFNLLFSQEHELPTLLLIWDGLLAHFDPQDPPRLMRFVFYVAIGHINDIQVRLEKGNYAATMHTLQNLTNLNIKAIIGFANACWLKDHPPEEKRRIDRFMGFFSRQ